MYFLKIFITISLLILQANASSNTIKTIAFVQDDMSNDFRAAQVYDARDEAKKYSNVNFVYSDAKGKTSLLIRHIEKFAKSQVDLLIISTNNSDAVVPVISKLYKNKIPIVILDRGINSNEYTTFLTADNYKVGEIAAKYLLKEMQGKGRLLILEGIPHADVTKLRTKGFLDVLQSYEDIKITKRTGNFLRKDTIIEMEKLLKSGAEFDAIYSQSDSMLSGVRIVFKKFKINPSSLITIGVDFIAETKIAMGSAKQTASVKFPLGGKEAVKVAMKILAGKEVQKNISLPIKLITNENLNTQEPIF